MPQPAEPLRDAARRAWPYFAPIWVLPVAFLVTFQTLAAAGRDVFAFFWAVVAPAWLVAFFVPDLALARGVVTLRQRLLLGIAVPFLLWVAAVTAWNLAWIALH